jgi:hypothetical protein
MTSRWPDLAVSGLRDCDSPSSFPVGRLIEQLGGRQRAADALVGDRVWAEPTVVASRTLALEKLEHEALRDADAASGAS